MKKDREPVSNLLFLGMLLSKLFIALLIIAVLGPILLAGILFLARDTITDFESQKNIAYIFVAIVAVILSIIYLVHVKLYFGKFIDVIYNLLFLLFSVGIGTGIGFFVYPNHFHMERLGSGFTAETIVYFIYAAAPVVAIIISVFSHWFYAFTFYSRWALDWLFMPLFITLMLGVFTLILFFAKWIVAIAGSMVGIAALIIMFPAMIWIVVYKGLTR